MIRFLAILALLPAALLISTAAHAERIQVTSGRGNHLLSICAISPDARFVSTNKNTYSGCCSEELGYCILCPRSGECYKFIGMKALGEFRKDSAPDAGVIADDKPVRPSRVIRKTAPSSNKIIE
jgi:hypothetical protein